MCNLLEEYLCANVALNNYATLSNQSLCNCPRACYSRVYSTSISQSVIATFVLDFLQNYIYNMTLDQLRNEYLAVDVYYLSMEYLDVTTTPAYTPLAFLCDIGGAIGLFLGSTFITVYEISEFVVKILLNLIHSKFMNLTTMFRKTKK